MKSTELRIGNIIRTGRIRIIVTQIISRKDNIYDNIQNSDYYISAIGIHDDTCVYGRWMKHLEPIELTDDEFINFGLLKTNGISYLLGCYEIVYSKGFNHWNVILKNGVIAKLKYVHQLQNLYFALTNEELILVEND